MKQYAVFLVFDDETMNTSRITEFEAKDDQHCNPAGTNGIVANSIEDARKSSNSLQLALQLRGNEWYRS